MNVAYYKIYAPIIRRDGNVANNKHSKLWI
jgi:hypothetical protein